MTSSLRLQLCSLHTFDTTTGQKQPLKHERGPNQIARPFFQVRRFRLAVETFDVDAAPPAHVGSLLDQVITDPTGDWHVWDTGVQEVLLPTDLTQHILHFVGNFGVSFFLVTSGIAVHLVNTNYDLLYTQQVDQTRVLSGLTLDLTSLVVTTEVEIV